MNGIYQWTNDSQNIVEWFGCSWNYMEEKKRRLKTQLLRTSIFSGIQKETFLQRILRNTSRDLQHWLVWYWSSSSPGSWMAFPPKLLYLLPPHSSSTCPDEGMPEPGTERCLIRFRVKRRIFQANNLACADSVGGITKNDQHLAEA